MKTLMFFLSLCLTTTAYAEQKGGMTLSFEEFRVACENPAKFHSQIAPSDIQVSCKDIQYKWVPDSEGLLTMGASRQITAAIYSNKYSMSEAITPFQIAAQQAACPKFKQVAETVETVRAVTCEELLAFKGSAAEFCVETVDALRAANKEAISVQDTGRALDLCSGAQGAL